MDFRVMWQWYIAR